MRNLLLCSLAFGMFMRDPGDEDSQEGGSGTPASETIASTTADVAAPAPAPAPATSLAEIVKNHFASLAGDDKRELVIEESGKLLKDIESIAANNRNCACINDLVTFQIGDAKKIVEDVTAAYLDGLAKS